MHKLSLSLEKYAGVVLLRPEYAGVSSGVEKIAPDFCRSKKIYSGRSSVWSPLFMTLLFSIESVGVLLLRGPLFGLKIRNRMGSMNIDK